MNLIFFGNSKYSVIVASALQKKFGLTAVVTIPDRPIGRKKILTPSPVKQFAVKHKIPSFDFDKLDKLAVEEIRKPKPDFFVVADYGLILPDELLAIPKFAPLNVHHSLLPKYRGPSPAPTAILNGEKVSGVTIIKMTDEVDAGPIYAQKGYTLKPDETTDSLLTMLNTIGGQLVTEIIDKFQSITPQPQVESQASLTKHMTKQDGYIDLENPPSPEQLDRMVRAYFPWPNVWTRLVLRSDLISGRTIRKIQGPTFQRERLIKFLPQQKILVEGGKPMSMKDFLNGYPEMKKVIERLELRG